MENVERLFNQEIREKKSVGRNAKYMNRSGKGSVRMPSDYLSRKEKKQLNGPVTSYDMGKPMTYQNFKKMPEDLQRAYLQGIIERFHPTQRIIGELWGISHDSVGIWLRKLGVSPAGGRGKRSNFDKDAWEAWIADDIIPEKPVIKDDAPVEETLTPPFECITKREEILRAAEKCVMGDREQDYGSPEQNFKVIADMWNVYVGGPRFQPKDVAAMLALLKIARIASGHAKADNWIDLAGYAACGGELEEYGRSATK